MAAARSGISTLRHDRRQRLKWASKKREKNVNAGRAGAHESSILF
jgi:hypothetical protein